MILVNTEAQALALSNMPVYIADLGSNIPHSVCVDGQIHQLMDPPELSAIAGAWPSFLTQDVANSL